MILTDAHIRAEFIWEQPYRFVRTNSKPVLYQPQAPLPCPSFQRTGASRTSAPRLMGRPGAAPESFGPVALPGAE